MDPVYEQALNGTLVSKPGAALPGVVFIKNRLQVAIQGYYVETNGLHVPLGSIMGLSSAPLSSAAIGDAYVFKNLQSGAFIAAFVIDQSTVQNYFIAASLAVPAEDWNKPLDPSENAFFLLTNPNDIGPIPEPTQSLLIPQNSPSVLVGCGTIPAITTASTRPKQYVVREQYWALMGDSFTLSPGEVRQVSYTVTSGKQKTSSTQEQVSASLGMNASAGWGAYSAGISASLNASASAFQQCTVTEETQTFVSDTFTNKDANPTLVLRWQLSDVVTIYGIDGIPGSTVSSSSIVVAKQYDLANMPGRQERARSVPRPAMPRLG
ncbi:MULTISPECIES: hypothetical protein [Roseomonadaceae]|uniref:Uncharacterized protein n=1 Tax=Falsiroseomonas oleicola TaxID=2801474 RepID=A0ABS6H8I0_9PROT|nr:hypothetical protein [Roseomonas oleicola]MBU8545015.1 hypothetical protein [Roseomonas oleicola]